MLYGHQKQKNKDQIYKKNVFSLRLMKDYNKKTLYYLILALAIASINLTYFVKFYIANKYLPAPFILDLNNTFMDFYNPLSWSIKNDAYLAWKSVYPPINFIFLKFISYRFEIISINPFELRNSNTKLSYIIMLIYLSIIIYSFTCNKFNTFKIRENILFSMLIVISTPVLFAIERGNLVVFSLLFLTLYINSRNRINELFCLIFLMNIKPYFVILLIAKANKKYKDYKFVFFAILFCALVSMLTGLFVDFNIFNFIENYLGFGKSGVMPAQDILMLPSSINALSSYGSIDKKIHSFQAFLTALKIVNYCAIIFLIYLAVNKNLNFEELLLLLIILITNFSTSVGGYSYIFYIPIIPIILSNKLYKKLIIYIAIIFIFPLDLISIYGMECPNQSIFSYLGQDVITNQICKFSAGSVIRPICNFLLMCNFIYLTIQKK